MLFQSRKRAVGSPSTRALKRPRSPSPEVGIFSLWSSTIFSSSGLTQVYSHILARINPYGGIASDVNVSPRVFSARSSPSKPRAPMRLKKKVRQDPPQAVFSMGGDVYPEDLEEEAPLQRCSTKKPSQDVVQVFSHSHLFSSSEVSLCEF